MEKQNLRSTITEDIKVIQREKNSKKLLVMRTLSSELLAVEKKLGRTLNDEEVIDVVKSALKYRNESLDYAKQISDDEKIQEQEKAIELLMKYMPKQLTDEEAKAKIREIIEENGFIGKKDMGKAMKAVISKINGQYDGKKINPIVSEVLG